ncbi:MAG TPA: signal peptidase II [Thermomicrobiales bacterium]|jgi:signal peptidase II|nr:signal peptidase II [Thermomicrobiales bacterium]
MRRFSGREFGARLAPLAIAAPLVAIDRVSKDAVVHAIGPAAERHRIDLLGRWLALAYAENRGVAFGLFGGLSWFLPLVAVAIVLAIGIAYARQRRPPLALTVAAGLATGGAIGNLIDRVRLGYVIDFIAVGPWPNFNVADAGVTLGVAGFVVWAFWTGGEATRPAGRPGDERAVGEGTGAR